MSEPPRTPSASNAGDGLAISFASIGGHDSINFSSDGAGDESVGGSSKMAELSEDEVRSDGVSSESDESSEEEGEDDFLCTFICDLLASLPRSSNQCWDEGICRRVSAGLKKCHWLGKFEFDVSDAEQIVVIDIRGRHVDDAKRDLTKHLVLYSRIPNLRDLKVVVGCKVHGVGKGKLRLAITEMLEHDKTIEWKRENGGSIISIRLDDKKDYSSLGGDVGERSHSFGRGQEGLGRYGGKEEALSQVVTEAEGAVINSTEEEDFLCTFISDFLFGIPKLANTCWDREMWKRVVGGLSRCDRALREECERKKFHDSDNIVDDSVTIGLLGQSEMAALDIFKRNLYCFSALSSSIFSIRYLKVEVGCKVHGVGKGKLKQAILNLLEMEEDLKWKEDCGGSVISIELDGRQCFNFVGGDFISSLIDGAFDDDHVDE